MAGRGFLDLLNNPLQLPNDPGHPDPNLGINNSYDAVRQRFSRYAPAIIAAAQAKGYDPKDILATVMRESGFDNDIRPWPVDQGYAGEEGLFQLTPQHFGGVGGNGPRDPVAAANYAMDLLANLRQRYHGNNEYAHAAYNTGPGAVDRAGGVPQNGLTPGYVKDIQSWGAPGGWMDMLMQQLPQPKPQPFTPNYDFTYDSSGGQLAGLHGFVNSIRGEMAKSGYAESNAARRMQDSRDLAGAYQMIQKLQGGG